MTRFPQVREMMVGRDPSGLTPENLVKMVPDAIACVIAAGTGSPGDPAAEAVAESLGAQDQLELLEAILEATLPKGPGPFVEKLMALASVVGGDLGNIPGMKSPPQSSS
jgi:hypothetical protein